MNTRDGCLFSAIFVGLFVHFASLGLPKR